MIQFHWHTEPALLLSLLFTGWGYALLVGPLRAHLGAVHYRVETALFYLGLAFTYLIVGSPLDQLGEQFLFSAHMIQHILLIYVAPLFFYYGTPSWVVDGLLRSRACLRLLRILTNPVVGGGIFTLCFTVWHVPALYNAALHSKPIHIFEHITMFVTASLMWWPIVSRSTVLPAISYGVRMLYVFVLMVGQLPVFGLLSFSTEIYYTTYEYAARLEFFNISPIHDQVLGGVIMKVANMVVSLVVLGVSFYMWYKQDAPLTSDQSSINSA